MHTPTIVWDFNGTLLDDVRACLDALNSFLRARNLPQLSREDYRRRFGFPVADFYHALGMDFATPFDWESLGESFHMRYLFSPHLGLQPGAAETVRALHARGIRQGVLSALEQGLLEVQLAQFGLAGAMDFIRGSRNYEGASKEAAADALRLRGADGKPGMSARFWNKHLTITSLDPENPVTLTRGETVAVVHDPARSNYNPAQAKNDIWRSKNRLLSTSQSSEHKSPTLAQSSPETRAGSRQPVQGAGRRGS